MIKLVNYRYNNCQKLPFSLANGKCLHDPLWIRNDPNAVDFQVEGLTLSDADAAHLDARWELRQRIDNGLRRLEHDPQTQGMDAYQQRAMHLLTSTETRRALQIGQESASVRDRYGRNTWGQSILLARRLVEAGVPLINVYLRDVSNQVKAPFGQWDTHTDMYPTLKDNLLPPFDRALSALLTDLDSRGLLAETLVVAAGEFGRTPRIGQVLTGAGARNGRDHWPWVYSVLCAGGGFPGGFVYGSSDRIGARPASQPVSPADFAATLYQLLGIAPSSEIHDQQKRPYQVSEGRPVAFRGERQT